MRIGILGGTFDPIHVAHLHAAETALHQAGLDKVLIIPAGDPWQKSERSVTSSGHRLAMCRLAVSGVDGLEVDGREVERDGPTFTADTLLTFDDADELFLILGADSISRIHTWERWSEVLKRVKVLVAPRPGDHAYDPEHGETLAMRTMDVSATDIRARVSSGEPFRFLVTEDVHEYIKTNHLYISGSGVDNLGESDASEES